MTLKKTLVGYVCVMAAVFTMASASAAQRGQKSTDEILKEELELIVKECKPNDEQQKSLKEKFKAKQDALEAWDKTNGEKMKAAQTAATAARKGADADAKKKANADLKSLQTERELSAAEADKAIQAVLNDDQKNLLAGAQLTVATLAKYKKSAPNEEQTAKIKAACAIAAKELAGFTGDDKKSKQGKTEVNKCLKWAIDNVILNELPKAAAPAAPATPVVTPEVKAPEAK